MATAFTTHVNTDGLDQSGSSTTIATTTGFSSTTGNFIVVATRCNSTTATVTSVADTAGNTYHLAVSKSAASSTIELWYAENITGNASNKVTATFSSSVNFTAIAVMELIGVKTSGSLDTTASGAGAGQGTSGSFSTASAQEIVISAGNAEAVSNIWSGVEGTLFTGIFYSEPNTEICIAYTILNATISAKTVRLRTSQNTAQVQMVLGTFLLATASSGSSGASYGFA